MGFRGYWDAHEEDLLRRGVQKHGIGSWERIRHDPDFKILKCVCGRAGLRHAGSRTQAGAVRLPQSCESRPRQARPLR